jgi:hypothetical protein
MKKMFFLALIPLFVYGSALGQTPFERLEMGMSAKEWKEFADDVSNPESWEETRFELRKPALFFGVVASQTRLLFWNDRLYAVEMEFPDTTWAGLTEILRVRYGEPWKMDSAAREGRWGEALKGVWTRRSGASVWLTAYDNTQKDFQWRDVFKGVMLYVILTLAGLFAAYFLIAHLVTSFCPRCKAFSMELQEGVHRSNLSSYHTDASLFSTPHIEYDVSYTYKCKRCGYVRRDTYSGWRESYRKTRAGN